MEADKGTEEPHVTTEDAEEHPSSKDPSAEDSQEPPIPEIPLEPLASKSHIVPSTSQIPLETHTSETPLEPPIPGTPLAHSASEVLLETPISKVPEKDLTFHTSSRSPVPGSSSNDLKKDLLSHSPSSEDTSESEGLQKHPLSGPPAQVHLDTSAKEREEEKESKKGVNATDRTTHKAQHEHQQGKKKRKKGVSRYAVHPVVPAQQAELGEAVKAVHREKCGAQVNYLFQWEKDAALNAIQTGLYIGWRCPHYLWDCFRIGEESKCFCGHLLREHQIISDISVPCSVGQCRCLVFCFIPSRPEEVGEFWLKRRAIFDPRAWRAQCRCKHSHEDHAANGSHSCRVRGCCCSCFESNFLCAACDRRWEEHETFFETEETRRRGGRPHGADHTPFAEMSTLREAISNNSDSEAPQKQAPSDHPHSYPSPPGLPPTVRPGPMSGPRT